MNEAFEYSLGPIGQREQKRQAERHCLQLNCIMLDLRMRGGYERACEIRDRIKEALKPGGTPFSIEWPNTFAFRMWLAIVFAAITLLKLLFALRVLKIEDIGKQQNPD